MRKGKLFPPFFVLNTGLFTQERAHNAHNATRSPIFPNSRKFWNPTNDIFFNFFGKTRLLLLHQSKTTQLILLKPKVTNTRKKLQYRKIFWGLPKNFICKSVFRFVKYVQLCLQIWRPLCANFPPPPSWWLLPQKKNSPGTPYIAPLVGCPKKTLINKVDIFRDKNLKKINFIFQAKKTFQFLAKNEITCQPHHALEPYFRILLQWEKIYPFLG